MDSKKIIEVVEMYQSKLSEAHIPKLRMNPERTFESLNKVEILAHAHFLTNGTKEYAKQEKMRKAGSHLSAIQMCLSFAGWYTLDDLMSHNKPDVEGN